ncbi:MAG: sugar kinase [Chloroflexi bacterium UTCFX4]|nr:MAG: sugar kinase [Chloroflexi bacterium UTCFX4]
MTTQQPIYIGTDGGATTSKIGGVWADASPISTTLLQNPTNGDLGPDAVVRGWVQGVDEYLRNNHLTWAQVQGVGVAIPGPRLSYGVLERAANLPASFAGLDIYTLYHNALVQAAGRDILLTVGNDGNMGGVAEAARVRGDTTDTALMLAPGSGLGAAYMDGNGFALEGASLAGMEGGHMPAPLHLLNAKPYPCGCGRDWGCVEMYTCIAGLPFLLAEKLREYPDHLLAHSTLSPKERALQLRGLAQQGDQMAQEIFDFQARALGLHVANLAMALDPRYVIIGGGLMDPTTTTDAFRARYLKIVWKTAEPYFWTLQRQKIKIVPAALGDLSQAIGAALIALYTARGRAPAAS